MPSVSERNSVDISSSTPLLLRQILPAFNERAILVGRTGSGKTTLAEHLCRHFPFVAVYDPKRRIFWQGFARYEQFTELITAPGEETHLIYAPPITERLTEKGEFAPEVGQFFWWVFERQNTFLYVDEAAMVTRGDVAPMGYHACIAQGREIGVGVLTAAQRPKKIPQVILSEAEHFYVFDLQLSQDRERMIEVTGMPLLGVGEHDFAYLRNRSGAGFQKFRLTLAGEGPGL